MPPTRGTANGRSLRAAAGAEVRSSGGEIRPPYDEMAASALRPTIQRTSICLRVPTMHKAKEESSGNRKVGKHCSETCLELRLTHRMSTFVNLGFLHD